jgi:hypothetical protein
MIPRNCNAAEFVNRIRQKRLVCFGAGGYAEKLCDLFPAFEPEKHIRYFVDNDPTLWGTAKAINGSEIAVKRPGSLYADIDANTVMLISTADKAALSIFDELEAVPELKNTECYFAVFFAWERDERTRDLRLAPDGFRMNDKPVIPKTIHYAWFGGADIPEKNRRCIESWKKFCPDYEIVKWSEDNYDIAKNQFMLDAHKAKKWAFVTDFARIDVIHEHGGIFLDTDVELLKSLDELLCNTAFCGFGSNNFTNFINFGSGVGSVSGLPILRKFMNSYDDLRFVFDENDYDKTLAPLACPHLQTDVAVRLGLKPDGSFQTVEGMAFYPSVYFDPLGRSVAGSTEHAYSIHWYDASWWPGHRRRALREWSDLRKLAAENEGIA